MSSHTFSPAKPLDTLAKIISSTLLFSPSCINAMLAIPHLSQVSSMAEIDSKEAQKKSKAGICFKTYLTQQAHLVFALAKEAQAANETQFSNVQNNKGNKRPISRKQFQFESKQWKQFSIKTINNNQVKFTNHQPINPRFTRFTISQLYASISKGVSKTDFDNYVKAMMPGLKNVQNQGQNLQNQMANVTSLLTSLCNNFKDSASTSNSGTLPSQTVTNPRQQINAITTRSGKTLEGPSTPLVPTPVVSNPQKEPEQNPETSTEKVQNPNLENTAHVPPPEEEDSIFIEIPKPKAKKTVNVEIQDVILKTFSI
ncbi:hypothetical protein Tco_0267761 [Tanacetum coccineum]